MNYPDSVQFLYSLGNEIKTAKFGLERISAVLEALGRPQDRCRVIHVAGTNGKGSTCAMIDAGLRAAGLRTGLFTSPHLAEPTERIRVNGAPVSAGRFAAAFSKVHAAVERLLEAGLIDLHATYFETVTAMALLVFAEEPLDAVTLEVGLGGRLDATNVVSPELCVITPIDFDHEAYLGRSLEAIAGEKAGILKPGVPALFAAQRREARQALEERAAELEIEVSHTADWRVSNLEIDARGSRFDLDNGPTGESACPTVQSGTGAFACQQRAPGDSLTPSHRQGSESNRATRRSSPNHIPASRPLQIRCPLAGEHQIENAVTAAAALTRFGISANAIETGIANAAWPGRLERVSERPEIILDGAHNPAGARALAAYIDRFYRGRRVRLIYGAMRDKAVAEIGGILFPHAHQVIVTAPRQARALSPSALGRVAEHPNLISAPTLEAALAETANATEDDAIFITGSLFLVAEARALLVK